MNISELLSFFFLFGVVLSVFFSANLYVKLASKQKADFALKWFLFFVLVHVLYVLLSRYLLLNDFFLGDATPFSLLYMPFYWYAICLSQNKTISTKQIVLHFIPAFLLWTFFFVLLSNDELSIQYYTLFKSILHGVFAALVLGYGAFGCFVFLKRIDKIIDVHFKQLIIVSSSILVVVSILFFIHSFKNDDIGGNITSNINLLVHILLLVFILSINRMWSYRIADEKEYDNTYVEDPLNKYHKSRIKDTELKESVKALEEMEVEIYLDVDLNSEKLSKHLGISRYELSQVFSIGLETSFTKYVNQKRCEYASELLLNRKDTHDTIEHIAFESGFNSNTTFYRAFKENYGVPPSKYN